MGRFFNITFRCNFLPDKKVSSLQNYIKEVVKSKHFSRIYSQKLNVCLIHMSIGLTLEKFFVPTFNKILKGYTYYISNT